jgi:hypothetical protein
MIEIIRVEVSNCLVGLIELELIHGFNSFTFGRSFHDELVRIYIDC